MQQHVLIEETQVGGRALSDEELRRELATMFLRYVGIESTARAPRPRAGDAAHAGGRPCSTPSTTRSRSPRAGAYESLKATIDTVFDWQYELKKQNLLNLYEKGKTLAWNANDLDWSIDVNIERMVRERVANGMAPMMNSLLNPPVPLSDKEVIELQLNINAFMLSQFLHGEQGALLATAKIVQGVPWEEAKFYAANQVADEARHVEVYHRYLTEKLGLSYEITPSLNRLLDDIILDPRWDITFLGMQIMVEGLALAAFGVTRMQMADEPLIQDLIGRVMARRVAPRRLRRAVALRSLHQRDERHRAARARGLRHRGDAPAARPPADDAGVRAPRLGRQGVDRMVAADAVHARLPPDDVLQDRPQPEAPRPADAARARRLRQARPAAVRARQGLGRGSGGDAAAGAGRAAHAVHAADGAGERQPAAAQ